MKLNPRGNDDIYKVFVKTTDGKEVLTFAYLSPEFDDNGFLRIMGQKKAICVHKTNVALFTWEIIDETSENSTAMGIAAVKVN